MKKLMIGAFALMMGLAIVSCNKKSQNDAPADNQPAAAASEAGSTTVTENEEEGGSELAKLARKAAKEGADWSAEEWRNAYKELLIEAKPTLLVVQEIGKMAKENKDDQTDMLNELVVKQEQIEDMSKQMGVFWKAAEASKNGQAALSDNKWKEQLLKELGLPKDL